MYLFNVNIETLIYEWGKSIQKLLKFINIHVIQT